MRAVSVERARAASGFRCESDIGAGLWMTRFIEDGAEVAQTAIVRGAAGILETLAGAAVCVMRDACNMQLPLLDVVPGQ
ncbi:hypothetical protein GCM10010985_00100 [Caballeronia grimmiae]|uniref:Uncharacterized protein n=1 Tax=Caballeronia grimmiae TaxID=1071679 RepID=A0ABQ1QZR5_9BURK|nr:hypothetical protein GCM10010985_00100 [Caballeronia grimmiae]